MAESTVEATHREQHLGNEHASTDSKRRAHREMRGSSFALPKRGEERFVCDRTNDSSPASLRGTSWVFICTTVAVVDRNICVRALQTARSSCELRPLSLTTRRAEGLRRKGVESSMRGRSLCDALAMVCTIPKGVDSASAKRSKTTSVRAATHVKACEFRTSKGVRNAVSPLLGEHVVVRNACELRLMG